MNQEFIDLVIMSEKDDDKVSFSRLDNSSTEFEGHHYKLNLLMFKRLGNILKILFPSCTAIPSLMFFILLLSVSIYEVVSYYNGLLPSNYYQVFLSRDNSALFKLIMMTVCMIVATAVLASCAIYARNTVAVAWRHELTTALQRYYLYDLNYYKMNVVERKVDNPDQRITQDVDKMCSSFIEILRTCIMCPIIISFYSYKAYQVSGMYALIGSYSYILFTLLINLFVTSPIVKYKAEVEKREGDFRFNHINIRVNAEAVAFQRAEPIESKQANRKLHFLLRAMQRAVNRVALAGVPMGIFINLQNLISFIVMAVTIMQGFYKDTADADLGAIVAKNHFYIFYITSTFMDVVSNYEAIAEVAGTVHRIGEMFETMKLQSNSKDESFDKSDAGSHDVQYKLYDHKSSSGNDEVVPKLDDNGNSTFCVFDDVTVLSHLSTNYGEIAVLKHMSFVFELGRNVLITGSGSCGKTTVLRLMRGLWEVSGGTVYRSNLMRLGSSAIFFQPAKILFCEGSFKQQIQFPDINDFRFQCDEDDATILRFVKMFHLDGLVSSIGGLDSPVNWNWYNVLSPNEAQRLCLARILYHRPKVIAIDNIFYGLEQSLIETFYNQCRKIGSTVVSVGDEDRLEKYHDTVINLNERDVNFFALSDR